MKKYNLTALMALSFIANATQTFASSEAWSSSFGDSSAPTEAPLLAPAPSTVTTTDSDAVAATHSGSESVLTNMGSCGVDSCGSSSISTSAATKDAVSVVSVESLIEEALRLRDPESMETIWKNLDRVVGEQSVLQTLCGEAQNLIETNFQEALTRAQQIFEHTTHLNTCPFTEGSDVRVSTLVRDLGMKAATVLFTDPSQQELALYALQALKLYSPFAQSIINTWAALEENDPNVVSQMGGQEHDFKVWVLRELLKRGQFETLEKALRHVETPVTAAAASSSSASIARDTVLEKIAAEEARRFGDNDEHNHDAIRRELSSLPVSEEEALSIQESFRTWITTSNVRRIDYYISNKAVPLNLKLQGASVLMTSADSKQKARGGKIFETISSSGIPLVEIVEAINENYKKARLNDDAAGRKSFFGDLMKRADDFQNVDISIKAIRYMVEAHTNSPTVMHKDGFGDISEAYGRLNAIARSTTLPLSERLKAVTMLKTCHQDVAGLLADMVSEIPVMPSAVGFGSSGK